MLSRIARSFVSNHNVRRLMPRELSLRQQQQQRQMASLRLSTCKKYLVVDEPKNQLKESKFPLVWLRDNCQCPSCFHPEVERRIVDWNKFKFNQQLESYTVSSLTHMVCWTSSDNRI